MGAVSTGIRTVRWCSAGTVIPGAAVSAAGVFREPPPPRRRHRSAALGMPVLPPAHRTSRRTPAHQLGSAARTVERICRVLAAGWCRVPGRAFCYLLKSGRTRAGYLRAPSAWKANAIGAASDPGTGANLAQPHAGKEVGSRQRSTSSPRRAARGVVQPAPAGRLARTAQPLSPQPRGAAACATRRHHRPSWMVPHPPSFRNRTAGRDRQRHHLPGG